MCRRCIGSAFVATVLCPLAASSPADDAQPVARPRMTMLEPATVEEPAARNPGRPGLQPKRPPVRGRPARGDGQAVRGPAGPPAVPVRDGGRPQPRPVGEAVDAGIAWLVAAQAADGGWGEGGDAMRQPRAAPQAKRSDPATTAFAAGALVRAGHTPLDGDRAAEVRRATELLCSVVESAARQGPKITDLADTQIQRKLGPLVDTAATARYLACVLPQIPPEHELHRRVATSLDVCVRKLQAGQQPDGSWGTDGWAPVAQSALACSALELAQAAAGTKPDQTALYKARDYLKRNVDSATGRVEARAAAGVPLYAFAGAQRACAAEARAGHELIAQAQADDKVGADAVPNEQALRGIGLPATAARSLAAAARAAAKLESRIGDESLLRGFGNNGGEEFLSFCLISEALAITGAEAGDEWNRAMEDRLAAAQNADGSWSGQHCITSAAFCTAAVVQCLTVHLDSKLLGDVATQAAEQAVAGR